MTAVFEGATNVLGLAGSIGTLIALAALSLLVAYLLAAQWLHGKGDAAKAAIDKGDDRMLARLLGGTSVPLDKLSPDQKYTLALEELRTRARQRTIGYSLVFFAFLALLGFGLALGLSPRREGQPGERKPVQLDLLAALNVLRYVPASERSQLCLTLMAKDDCERAASMIASLSYQAPTAQQSKAIVQAVATGQIDEAQATQLAACGGKFDFKVVENMLACADGSTLPVIAISDGRRLMEAQSAIVLHATVTGKNAPFASVASLLANGRPPDLPGPLAHLLISSNGAVAQTASMNHVASHVGIGTSWHGQKVTNSNAIGVELIHTGDYQNDPYPPIQLDATTAVVRALAQAYGIKIVVGHDEVAVPAGRKTDPGPGVAADIRRRADLPAPSTQ